MNRRLIDANEYPCRSSKCGISYCYQRCDKFWDWLERNPAIDAVEVIHCEDCIHGHYCCGYKKYECHHPLYPSFAYHRGRHYCSYGEKRI